MREAKTMQPENYKPKTTIIPANPGFLDENGHAVVAWVIEDGRVARAITFDPNRPVPCASQRGGDE